MSDYDFDYTTIDEPLSQLENRISHLEQENIGLTNELYELQNQLDALEVYHDMNTLKQFTLEK